MRTPPRTSRTLAALLFLCVLPCAARPQGDNGGDPRRDPQPAAKQGASKQTAQKQGAQKKPDAGAARKARESREAVAALREVADAARAFDDLYESLLVQSDAADALWPFDEQAARATLRRAWEAATAPGAEDKVKSSVTSADASGDARATLLTARRFVIKAALKHDTRLADVFMREFEHDLAEEPKIAGQGQQTSAQQDGQSDNSDSSRPDGRRLSPAAVERLTIANQLLADGEFKQAAEVAAPVASEGPTVGLLIFILNLRAHDAADADALYLRLLEATRADASADANDVLLLSTPVVSPGLNVSVNQDGSTNLQVMNYGDDARLAAVSLSRQGRLAFFDVAASVLLRPAAPRDGQKVEDSSSTYLAIGRLLPFFEREAPQYAPALHARQAALAAQLDAGRRDELASEMDVDSLSSGNPSDPLAPDLESVARAGSASERDLNRLMAVDTATRLGLWDRARGVAEQVEDAEARRGARLIIAVRQVLNVSRTFDGDDPEDTARAADFVRAADVPPDVCAVGLAQAAELAAGRGKGAAAGDLLAEAAIYAAQAERGERRVAALALVTLAAARVGDARVWELLQSLARADDEADDLPLDGLDIELFVGGESKYAFFPLAAPVNPSDAYAAAARLDATRAFTQARSLKDEESRAVSLLAAARAALEKGAATRAANTR